MFAVFERSSGSSIHESCEYSFMVYESYPCSVLALRQSQEIAQRCLFLKARLVSFLIDNYTPFPINDSDVPPKTAKEEVLNRHAARGVIMNCLNAIRLQASCQPPSSFLRQHLATHAKWNEFQPILLVSGRDIPSSSMRYIPCHPCPSCLI